MRAQAEQQGAVPNGQGPNDRRGAAAARTWSRRRGGFLEFEMSAQAGTEVTQTGEQEILFTTLCSLGFQVEFKAQTLAWCYSWPLKRTVALYDC